MNRAAAAAMCVVVAALLVVHGLGCAWSPLAGEDWRHVVEHGGWLAGHRSLAAALEHAVVRVPWLHAIGTPLATVALLAGVLTLAERRCPAPGRWSDVGGLVMSSTTLWIALPQAGAMYFYRPYAAAEVWGGALAVWLAAPYRCRWSLAGRAWPAVMFVAAALAATATRQLAVALMIGLAIGVRRTPRPARRAWMWGGLAGAVAGAIADNVRAPWVEAGRLVTRLEPTLVSLGPVLRAGGQLVALLGLVVLARLMARRAADDDRAPPVPGDTLAWFAAWLGLGVALRLGPGAGDALPAAIALCIAAWPIVRELAASRVVRGLWIAVAVAVHALAWSTALARYAELADDHAARLAAIAATPAGAIARVPPYHHILPDGWTIGDDWNDAALRETLARDHFGLRDIDLAPAFRVRDASPDLAFALEVDGASDAQLRAARPPDAWPRSLARARLEFSALVGRLRAGGAPASARLRITNLETAFPARHGRPIYAAWSDATAPLPVARRGKPDDNSQLVVTLPPAVAARYPDVWAVQPDRAEPLTCTGGRCRLEVSRAVRTVIVACDAARCGAADAWVPTL